MRRTTLPLSLLCLVLSAWTSIADPPPNPKPAVCCGDGGVEWRFQHLDKRFLNGEITEDERFRAIAAEAKGAVEGTAWVVAGFAVKLVLRGGRWLLLATRSSQAGSVAKGGIQLLKSVRSVMGRSYKPVGEVTAQIKNTDLLSALNKASKGDWVKVYEAGVKNGNKIEVHYFRNNTTGRVFDVRSKYNGWHQKSFKNLMP